MFTTEGSLPDPWLVSDPWQTGFTRTVPQSESEESDSDPFAGEDNPLVNFWDDQLAEIQAASSLLEHVSRSSTQPMATVPAHAVPVPSDARDDVVMVGSASAPPLVCLSEVLRTAGEHLAARRPDPNLTVVGDQLASTLGAAASRSRRNGFVDGSPPMKACGPPPVGPPHSASLVVSNPVGGLSGASLVPNEHKAVTVSDMRAYMDQMKKSQTELFETFFQRSAERHTEAQANIASLESTASSTLMAVQRLLDKTQGLEIRAENLESRIRDLETKPIGASEVLAERLEALEKTVESLTKHVSLLLNQRSASGPGFPLGSPRGGLAPGLGGPKGSLPHVLNLGSLIPPANQHTDFQPTAAFPRGWSSFESRQTSMLPGATVVQLMQNLLSYLPVSVASQVRECVAPYYRNWQGVFRFKKEVGPDVIFEFAKQINSEIRSRNIQLGGRDLYITVEKPAWKRQQNSELARAERTIRLLAPAADLEFKMDWASGQLWQVLPSEALLGGPHKNQWNAVSFKWVESAVARLGLEMSKVMEAFETDP